MFSFIKAFSRSLDDFSLQSGLNHSSGGYIQKGLRLELHLPRKKSVSTAERSPTVGYSMRRRKREVASLQLNSKKLKV